MLKKLRARSLNVPRVRSENDFRELIKVNPDLRTSCSNCSMPFSKDCVHTAEGWQQAVVTGICEDCMEDLVTFATGDEE